MIGILLPALSAAQENARTIKCASNLRNIGNGIAIYLAENKQMFPPAYIYAGQTITNGVQQPDAAVNGYIHWSSYLYGQAAGGKGVAADAFTCPSIENGGLPPTNPAPGNFDPGQSADNPGAVDQQVPRCGFTVNEAVMPRNKWVLGFQGARRVYKFVNAGRVKNSSDVILATEWNQSWQIVSDAGRSDPNETVCKSHRPIHGFVGLSGSLNMDSVPADPFGGRPTMRKVKESDVAADPKPGDGSQTRLDWIGRNHGRVQNSGGVNKKNSNFLYVDGHVETKHVFDTVGANHEWGAAFYSLSPGDDIVP